MIFYQMKMHRFIMTIVFVPFFVLYFFFYNFKTLIIVRSASVFFSSFLLNFFIFFLSNIIMPKLWKSSDRVEATNERHYFFSVFSPRGSNYNNNLESRKEHLRKVVQFVRSNLTRMVLKEWSEQRRRTNDDDYDEETKVGRNSWN